MVKFKFLILKLDFLNFKIRKKINFKFLKKNLPNVLLSSSGIPKKWDANQT